jgi:hypothetical protein
MQISKPLKQRATKALTESKKVSNFTTYCGQKYEIFSNFLIGIKFCYGHCRLHFHTFTDSASTIYQTVFFFDNFGQESLIILYYEGAPVQ